MADVIIKIRILEKDIPDLQERIRQINSDPGLSLMMCRDWLVGYVCGKINNLVVPIRTKRRDEENPVDISISQEDTE